MTSGKRMNCIAQGRLKSSRHAPLLTTTAPRQTRMCTVLWVVERRPLCSGVTRLPPSIRTLAVPPLPRATQIIHERTARRRSCSLRRHPTLLQLFTRICSRHRYLDQGLVWKERAPQSGRVRPRSRATSTRATHPFLPIPTSRRLRPLPTATPPPPVRPR